ncbi:Cobyrinic acid ac-diamide synthase [Chloroherpeton thalassium ATCC 35110]|uniref:Cobyrinic acid ac-diamide synthase n=1 Tax=Chloroherpeton thalassium (strain ATCC 35110 / GB-78) TaxID=517418 RepID=B3QYM5_CHLT3|nr:Cobyrinic acid ac-diamide synthase [Chloroherpeton thalassium ATCC 35110]
MGKVLAVANQKGGVGKTTTAVNLAASIAAAEVPTLLIDIDPQANATSGSGVTLTEEAHSIYEVLIEHADIESTVIPSSMQYLDVVPSDINLVGTEVELIDVPERERVLYHALGSVRKKYDYIIIDCPPSLGLITLNALTASDAVVIPVQAEYYALEGLGQLLNTISIVRRHLNPTLDIEGVLLTMFDGRLRLSNQVMEEVKKYFKEKVFTTVIRRNVKISEAPSHGRPVILYDAQSIGTKDYMDLAYEIFKRDGLENFTVAEHSSIKKAQKDRDKKSDAGQGKTEKPSPEVYEPDADFEKSVNDILNESPEETLNMDGALPYENHQDASAPAPGDEQTDDQEKEL